MQPSEWVRWDASRRYPSWHTAEACPWSWPGGDVALHLLIFPWLEIVFHHALLLGRCCLSCQLAGYFQFNFNFLGFEPSMEKNTRWGPRCKKHQIKLVSIFASAVFEANQSLERLRVDSFCTQRRDHRHPYLQELVADASNQCMLIL